MCRFSLDYDIICCQETIAVLKAGAVDSSLHHNDRAEQVAHSDVVAEDLGACRVDLRLLLANLLLKFGQLVLQGLNDLLSRLLGLFKLLVACDSLLAPVLVLLAHAVNIISYEVN